MHTATYSSMLLQSTDTCSSSICSLMVCNPSFSLSLAECLIFQVFSSHYSLHCHLYMNYELDDFDSKYDLCVYLKQYNPISVSENSHFTFDQIRSFHICLFLFLSLDFNKQVSVKNGIFCIVIWPLLPIKQSGNF